MSMFARRTMSHSDSRPCVSGFLEGHGDGSGEARDARGRQTAGETETQRARGSDGAPAAAASQEGAGRARGRARRLTRPLQVGWSQCPPRHSPSRWHRPSGPSVLHRTPPRLRTLGALAQVPAEMGESWPPTHNHASYLLTPPLSPSSVPSRPSSPNLLPDPIPLVSPMASPYSFLTRNVTHGPQTSAGRVECPSRTGAPAALGRQGRRQPHESSRQTLPARCVRSDAQPLGSDRSRPQRWPQTRPPPGHGQHACLPGSCVPATRPHGCHEPHREAPGDPCPDVCGLESGVLGSKQQRKSSEPQARPLPSYREVHRRPEWEVTPRVTHLPAREGPSPSLAPTDHPGPELGHLCFRPQYP